MVELGRGTRWGPTTLRCPFLPVVRRGRTLGDARGECKPGVGAPARAGHGWFQDPPCAAAVGVGPQPPQGRAAVGPAVGSPHDGHSRVSSTGAHRPSTVV